MTILGRNDLVGINLNGWSVHKWYYLHDTTAPLGQEDTYFEDSEEAAKAGKGKGISGADIEPETVFILTYDGNSGFPLSDLEMLTKKKK
jgi:hypothetical protein